MHSVVRVLAAAGLAAVSLTCADQSISGLRSRLAILPIAPAFQTGASGGPDIEVDRVRGVLRNASGTDSSVAEGEVQGDSAILEFLRVSVTGDSTEYRLGIQAFDGTEVVFTAQDTIQIKPGENAPATPELKYSAPDTVAVNIEIQDVAQSLSRTSFDLLWQGAIAGNTSCLNRVTKTNPTTQVALKVVGKNAAGVVIPNLNVRTGWRSLDTTVATVDDAGLVKSRCAKKTTQVIARTFLNRADTITINVDADPFTLSMRPEATSLERGKTLQLDAKVVDERGNESSATGMSWTSSDPTKASVHPTTGLVTALRNGRVQITASKDNRSTVGIVEVVRPSADQVKIIPLRDTATFGQVRQFVARALDAAGRVIGDAVEFTWSSTRTATATVDSKGVVTANVNNVVDTTVISATIDGKTGTGSLRVVSSLPPGRIGGIVRDGVTNAPVSGATVSIPGSSTTTNAQGGFLLAGVKQGDNISISKTGYETITFFDAPAFPDQDIFIDEIPLPPAGGTGTISGKVVNAINGGTVAGITVKAYAGLNGAPSPRNPGTLVAETTSGSNGTFTFANRAAGAYTFVASGTGYSQATGIGIVVGGTTRTATDLILPPTLPGSGIYVVLTWATAGGTNVPADLDLHVTGPTSETDATRFQIYSGNRVHLSGIDTVATIDIGDATGPGPEVASLRGSAAPGLYRFYVKNVGATSATSKALADSSDARVDIFQNNRIIATFVPPVGAAGTVWEVFGFDGARILPVGTVSTPANPNVLQSITTSVTPLAAPRRKQ